MQGMPLKTYNWQFVRASYRTLYNVAGFHQTWWDIKFMCVQIMHIAKLEPTWEFL